MLWGCRGLGGPRNALGSFPKKLQNHRDKKREKEIWRKKTEKREGEDDENKAAQAASVPALSVTRRGWGITTWQPGVVTPVAVGLPPVSPGSCWATAWVHWEGEKQGKQPWTKQGEAWRRKQAGRRASHPCLALVLPQAPQRHCLGHTRVTELPHVGSSPSGKGRCCLHDLQRGKVVYNNE